MYEAAVRVCGETLHWKNTLKKLFVRAGVKEHVFERYRHLSKFVIARSILDDLERLGRKGWSVQRRFVAELAALDRSEEHVPDPRRGEQALGDLRRLAEAERVLVNPEEADREKRRADAAEQAAARSARREELSRLYERFTALHREDDRQARGYALERLLGDLFRLHELEYTGSYKTGTDQIDGSVNFRSFFYLLEARWRQRPATDTDLGAFQHKVKRRLDATRGIYISMAGFRDEAVALYRLAQENPLILVDGQDLACLLEGRIDLTDALQVKVHAAAVKGEPYLRLTEL